MDRVVRMMAGLLLGAAVAAGLVLLFAPRSGAEMRQQIQERIQDILAEGREAADSRRLELTTQFENLKQPYPKS
jgi:gas vesicle protein